MEKAEQFQNKSESPEEDLKKIPKSGRSSALSEHLAGLAHSWVEYICPSVRMLTILSMKEENTQIIESCTSQRAHTLCEMAIDRTLK